MIQLPELGFKQADVLHLGVSCGYAFYFPNYPPATWKHKQHTNTHLSKVNILSDGTEQTPNKENKGSLQCLLHLLDRYLP